MKKTNFYILISFFLFVNETVAQTYIDQPHICPSTYPIECLTGSNDVFYLELVPCSCSTSGYDACEGVPNSPVAHIVFEARSSFISVDVTLFETLPAMEPSLYSGVSASCDSDCIAGEYKFQSSTVSYSTDELVPGRLYYIIVDTKTSHGLVDIEFADSDLEPIETITGIKIVSSEDCDSEYVNQDVFCAQSDMRISVDFTDVESANYVQDYYTDIKWILDGPGLENQEFTSSNLSDFENIDIVELMELPGVYTVCINEVTSPCRTSPIFEVCTTITKLDPSETVNDLGIISICSDELSEGYLPSNSILPWHPTYPLFQGGTFEVNYTDECGCQFYEFGEILDRKIVEEEITIELCPEDYPFEFNDFIFDYSNFNIEEHLLLERGSMNEDYNGFNCDSLIFLTLINEMPCASCELPVSLKNSKIVLCVPFDNSSEDVSGNNYEVIPVNINYDDYGSTDKIFWSAVFDGKDDRVVVPYIEFLNKSVYSFAFEFEKDEEFEDGPIETLVSQGDQSNLRYSIDLVQKSASTFDLIGRFFTANDEINLGVTDLQLNTEYDIAYVVENNSLSFYIDAVLSDQVVLTEGLRGSQNDLIMGAVNNSNNFIQDYNGRINDYKYWAQPLSGLDVLYLHDPLAEFIENIEIPLTCCEQILINETLPLSVDHPIQTIIVPEASETGYDSTYIYNFVQADPAPLVEQSLVPDDIVVQYQKQCDEFCAQTVSWNVDPQQIFSDNCGTLIYEQSHNSPLVIDENQSSIEVTYSAIDDCGNKSSFTFNVELDCLAPAESLISDNNQLYVEQNNQCFDNNGAVCINSEIKITPSFIVQNTTQLYNINEHGELDFTFTVNGQAQAFNFNSQEAFYPNFNTAGNYEVCLESIADDCVSKFVGACQTFEIYESQSFDYGTFYACHDDYISVVPQNISAELLSQINNGQNTFQASILDDCGCVINESINILPTNSGQASDLTIALCESETVNILGQTFDYSMNLNNTLVTFENKSIAANSNGEFCDSLVNLTITQLEPAVSELDITICEGGNYEGYMLAGTYQDVLQGAAANGCDSVRTLRLDVVGTILDTIAVSICQGESFEGRNESGIYVDQFVSSMGCDSLRTLELTVLENSETLITETVCSGEGETGIYETILQDSNGCDSIIILDLTVAEPVMTFISESICPDEEFMGLNESGEYEFIFVDFNGCDSSVNVSLTVLDEQNPQCLDTAVDILDSKGIQIFPNPSTHKIFVKNVKDQIQLTSYEIYDLNGRLVTGKKFNNEKSVDISYFSIGVYLINIKSHEFNSWYRFVKL